jgi:hypothetical protein
VGSERSDPNGTPVSLAADSVSNGYWIMTSDGGISNFNAPWYGSLGTAGLTRPPTRLAGVLTAALLALRALI